MKRFLDYNKKLIDRTKYLRKNMTLPEKKLWYMFLREISNTKFRIYKQRPINNFIVDFYIPKLKMVIEIDWESHFDSQWLIYDIERTQILEWFWLNVIRFTNLEIMKNFDSVCNQLEIEFQKLPLTKGDTGGLKNKNFAKNPPKLRSASFSPLDKGAFKENKNKNPPY